MPNILIADDHDLIRDTLGAYLGREDDFHVETVDSMGSAIEACGGQTSFDIAIIDYRMPGMHGLDGLVTAMRKYPKTKFVLMSGLASNDIAHKAMGLGASGFFPKHLSASTLISAIRLVLTGDRYFPFEMVSNADAYRQPQQFKNLTQRESETLRHVCQGKSNKEIAREMDVREVTVKLHVKNLLAKLGAKNRTQAALIAQEEGFS